MIFILYINFYMQELLIFHGYLLSPLQLKQLILESTQVAH